MNDTARIPRPARHFRIPLWDDHGQAERFAVLLAISAVAVAVPHVLFDRMVIAEICFGFAFVMLALCLARERGAPRWVLGVGTPSAMTLYALVLVFATGKGNLSAAALLAFAPAVGELWGSPRTSWSFLALAVVGSLFALVFAGDGAIPNAEPSLADPRALWFVTPLALGGLWLARSWRKAQGDYSEEVAASHAVLAASAARFKAYVENAHDVTAELDACGRVLFISGSHEHHYALPVADLLGTPGGSYIHPDDLPAARECFAAAAAGRPVLSPPLRYRWAGDGWRWLRVAVNTYHTADGSLRFVVHARDESALQEQNAARERRIAELEAALARAEAAARSAGDLAPQ
jgi:PAS domain S-box-containing protein